MRLKYLGSNDVDIPELGQIVSPGDIVDVDDETGKRMAESSLWRVTSRGKSGADEEEPAEEPAPADNEEG